MLSVGQKAPAFKGKDQNGNTVSLSDFKGKTVVIYFYPADNTPTCTLQACNLRDNFQLLLKNDIQVIGISPDDITSHSKFATKFSLPFPLIADDTLKIIEKYGVWGEKSMYGKKYMGLIRTTYIIDKKGTIQHVITKPKAKQHAEEIMSLLVKS
jgi:peroxiredoxin Q/BCP